MQIFGGRFSGENRSHFDTFPQSCLTVFQVNSGNQEDRRERHSLPLAGCIFPPPPSPVRFHSGLTRILLIRCDYCYYYSYYINLLSLTLLLLTSRLLSLLFRSPRFLTNNIAAFTSSRSRNRRPDGATFIFSVSRGLSCGFLPSFATHPLPLSPYTHSNPPPTVINPLLGSAARVSDDYGTAAASGLVAAVAGLWEGIICLIYHGIGVVRIPPTRSRWLPSHFFIRESKHLSSLVCACPLSRSLQPRVPHPQALAIPAQPTGLAHQLHRGHRLLARLALPLSGHLRPPGHAGLRRQVQGSRLPRQRKCSAQGQL